MSKKIVPLKLEDDQRFALMKFRRNIHDVMQPHFDDHFLLRWLRARKWDTAAAEKMLRDSLEWRKQWEVDKLEEWEPPECLQTFLPHGLSGYDKDGAPVGIVPFAGLDLYGILHMVSRKDMIKATIKTLEEYLRSCREQMEVHGPVAGQITVIFDMDGFNLRQYMWRPAGEVVLALIQMYEANYPEILKTCFIINAPKIYKNDPVRWKAAILNLVPENQLPVYFGGTLADPDGNPRYTTKICQGGKVPKHMYTKKGDKDKIGDFVTTVVRKGDKLKLEFTPDEDGSLLSWEFRTEDHDIKFGILKKGNDGSKSEIIPVHRVSAHQLDEIGILTCDVPATYSVIFDNSYSLLRNKKIHYSVRVLPPTNTSEDLTANP